MINSHLLPSYFNFLFIPEEKQSCHLFNEVCNLDDLVEIMTSEECSLDQWLEWKSDIKALIANHTSDFEKLDQFFTTITEWGMERNPQKTMAILIDIVSLDILTEVVRAKQKEEESFTNIFELASENASDCPQPVDTSLKGRLNQEWKRYRPIIIYFIPNLLNIFIGAFNFLDTNKKYTTLWEKHLLLEIVYKFFIIPYCLVQILQPLLLVTAKVYLVTALIIVTLGLLISCYQRWIRPLPDEIVNCVNLDKQAELGLIDPKVGQTEEIDLLIAALEAHDSVVLLGLSGEGKTALIHHFIQLKHAGKLPKHLQELTVYEVDCGLMISSISFGHSELINQTKEQINGHEDQVLLFFDDFYQIATNKAAFLAFKKRFLEDKPRCKCILAVTFQEWEEIKKSDIDYSFRRRAFRMKMTSSTDEQIRRIIKNYHLHFAQDVPVTHEAIEAIIELSNEKDYLPEIGRAAKAEEIFKTAIGISRAALNHHYGSLELDEKELKINHKYIQTVKKILAHQKKINTDYSRLSHFIAYSVVKGKPKNQEKDEINSEELGDIDIFDPDNDVEDEEPQEIINLNGISQKDQVLYLWYCFYARKAMEKVLENEMAKIDSDIPIQVNETLIRRVYDELKDFDSDKEDE